MLPRLHLAAYQSLQLIMLPLKLCNVHRCVPVHESSTSVFLLRDTRGIHAQIQGVGLDGFSNAMTETTTAQTATYP